VFEPLLEPVQSTHHRTSLAACPWAGHAGRGPSCLLLVYVSSRLIVAGRPGAAVI